MMGERERYGMKKGMEVNRKARIWFVILHWGRANGRQKSKENRMRERVGGKRKHAHPRMSQSFDEAG